MILNACSPLKQDFPWHIPLCWYFHILGLYVPNLLICLESRLVNVKDDGKLSVSIKAFLADYGMVWAGRKGDGGFASDDLSTLSDDEGDESDQTFPSTWKPGEN